MAHTPGPWELKPTSSGGLLVVRAEQSLQVFPVADAHLIAAAPDLLAALKAAVKKMGRPEPEEWSTEAAYADACDAFDEMLFAIAKAEGK